jgi:hypothetical protein
MLVKSHWKIMIYLELKQPSFSLELKQPSFLAALAALWYCDRLAAVADLLLTCNLLRTS